MERLHIALDVEGVLADSHLAAQQRSDVLDESTSPPTTWDFPTDEHYDEFMRVTAEAWDNDWADIPPVEYGLGEAVSRMALFHNVDIVTHRTGHDDAIQNWLHKYGIEYENFISTDQQKTLVGNHDVHIDDSPNVVDDVLDAGRNIMLVERPYNHVVERTFGVWAVSGVVEASELLTDSTIVERIKTA